MISRKINVFLFTAFAFFLVLHPAAFGQNFGSVIMPGADMMIQVKLRKMSKAPISLAIKEIQKQAMKDVDEQGFTPDKWDEMLGEITGLEEDDFLTLIGGVELNGIDFESEPDLSLIDAVMGMSLAKELSIDKLESGLKAFLAKNADNEQMQPLPVVSRVADGQNALLQLKQNDEAFFVAMTGGDKLMLIGSEKGVKGVLQRVKSGTKTSPRNIFPANIGRAVGGADCYVIVKPTPEMLAQMPGNPGDGPASPMSALFQNLKAFGFGVKTGETMDMAWVGDFGTAETAQQVKMLIQMQLFSNIKMWGSMMGQGKQFPVLNTLKATSSENGLASVTLSISKADLEIIKDGFLGHSEMGQATVPGQDGTVIELDQELE